jgi:predicted PurR-regulated permease PerM
MSDKPYTFDRVVRGILNLVYIAAFIWIMRELSGVLLPFAIAMILAFITDPIVVFFQRFLKKRSLSIAVTLILFLVLMIGFWMVMIPTISHEVNRAGKLVVNYASSVEKPDWMPENINASIKELTQSEEFQSLLTPTGIKKAAEKVLPQVWSSLSIVSGLLFSLIGLFIILLYYIFLLSDFPSISASWKSYIPEKFREQVSMMVNDLNEGMTSYFKYQTVIALIESAMFAIGFWIIGIPMAIVLGIFVGLLYFIPYMQNLGFVPAAFLGLILSLETGQNFGFIIIELLILFAIVAVVQETFLIPRIMGNLTGLNPAIILLSITVWGSLMGVFGMIIAVPITTIIISYYKRFVLKMDE